MKNGKFQRNIFILLLFLIFSLNADCDVANKALVGPQGVSGPISINIERVPGGTLGGGDGFELIVTITCNAPAICGEGKYISSYTTRGAGSVSPSTGTQTSTVTLVPAVAEVPLGCCVAVGLCVLPTVAGSCAAADGGCCTALPVAATLTPTASGFVHRYTGLKVSVGSIGSVIFTVTFNGPVGPTLVQEAVLNTV